MQVLKPNTVGLTDGSFTRASTGTYFDSAGVLQSAAANIPRITYNRATKEFEGLLLEPASTNLLLNSTAVATQTVAVSTTSYTLSFYGTGTVVISGGHTATVIGNANALVRTTLTFASTSSSVTLTITGSVTQGQLELGTAATSYIPTTTVAVTRAADVVNGSNLVYSTVTNLYGNWSSATTYALGTRVTYNSKTYESLQNSNLAKTPDAFPLFWLDLGYDNRHAAFDLSTSTGSTATTEQVFIVKTGKIDGLSLINLNAAVANISIVDAVSGQSIVTKTFGISAGTVLNWYDYFFNSPLDSRTQVTLIDSNLTVYSNVIITVKLTSGSGVTNSVGSVVFGEIISLGETQYGASVGIVDYSKKVTDEFGVTTFVERPFSKRLSTQMYFPNTDLNKIQRALYSVRATPCVWIATQDPKYEEALVVYGFYKDFSTTISYPTYSLCRIEIEGLT